MPFYFSVSPRGRWDRSTGALEILDEARLSGLEIDEVLYNTVMEACGAAGKTKLALSLLEVHTRGGGDGCGCVTLW